MAAMNAEFGAAIAVSTGPATYEHLLNHPEHKPHHVMRSMGELLGILQTFRDRSASG
jgi:phosphoglycolate phosphatase-like HAD superfamily hydrolase